jgi:methylglyoxal synthase
MTRKEVTIGLVAHNGRKLKMAEWANRNRKELREFKLVGTGGTAKKISQITGLEVESLGHGPNGGDIRIAYNILEQNIGVLIFFVDTSEPHGHEHDIQALIRMCVTEKIPLALNAATADCIIQYLLKD